METGECIAVIVNFVGFKDASREGRYVVRKQAHMKIQWLHTFGNQVLREIEREIE